MMFRPGRTRRGPDPTLSYRVALLVLGAAAGLGGMATGWMWLVTLGTVLLGAGLAIAIVTQSRRKRDGDPPGSGPAD
ncbi:MAG: hypothetical protein L0271_17255 [Gemmatimonadetes bacterium]|nr:hypothetical protein [Gemmatimonadota bacterium]